MGIRLPVEVDLNAVVVKTGRVIVVGFQLGIVPEKPVDAVFVGVAAVPDRAKSPFPKHADSVPGVF